MAGSRVENGRILGRKGEAPDVGIVAVVVETESKPGQFDQNPFSSTIKQVEHGSYLRCGRRTGAAALHESKSVKDRRHSAAHTRGTRIAYDERPALTSSGRRSSSSRSRGSRRDASEQQSPEHARQATAARNAISANQAHPPIACQPITCVLPSQLQRRGATASSSHRFLRCEKAGMASGTRRSERGHWQGIACGGCRATMRGARGAYRCGGARRLPKCSAAKTCWIPMTRQRLFKILNCRLGWKLPKFAAKAQPLAAFDATETVQILRRCGVTPALARVPL